jgi:hypothetical protein
MGFHEFAFFFLAYKIEPIHQRKFSRRVSPSLSGDPSVPHVYVNVNTVGKDKVNTVSSAGK